MRLMNNRAVIKRLITLAVAVGLSLAPGVASATEEGTADPITFLPKTQPYTQGMQIPVGYRLTEGPRKPLLIAGAITFGIGYLPMVIFGIAASTNPNESSGSPFTEMIPVVSPVLWAFAPYGSNGFNYIHTAFLVDGIVQAAGIGLLIAGAVTHGKYLKRQDIAAMVPSVSVGPRFVGVQWSF